MYSYLSIYITTIIDSVVVRWDDWTNCTRLCGGKGSQYRVKYCDDGTGEVECDRVTNPCGSTSCRSYSINMIFYTYNLILQF